MMFRAVIVLLLAAAVRPGPTAEVPTHGEDMTVDASTDGRLLIDPAGGLWVVPTGGGDARRIAPDNGSVQRPRWSPDASRVVFTARVEGRRSLWLHDLPTGRTERVRGGPYPDRHPAWHPGGERIAFASDRRDTGFDLWEVDLPTGLQWRLSGRPGDETEPAWSADGRDLVYVHRESETWSLVLRRHGRAEEVLVSGAERIAGPSWRPDGSLIAFWRDNGDGPSLDMVILSEPRLVRRYMDGEDYATAPVSWLDRHRMFYTARGLIRQRLFNSRSSRTVPFRATIQPRPDAVVRRVRRDLPRIDEPRGTLVVRASRLYDGLTGRYLVDRDVVIEGGRISAVEDRADRSGAIVIDMGDLAVLPGYVDARTRLPDGTGASTGPLLLAAGVTTMVAEHDEAEHLNAIWSGKAMPGPRLLPATDWAIGEYSALADRRTPGLGSLLASRPARLLGFDHLVPRRFGEPPVLAAGVTGVVLGSLGNGLPAGIATHAELRALVAAGLEPEQALRAAGVDAAAALGVDPRLGRIATGAVADLVFVDGDPLTDVDAALGVVAVVRNGRFFSVAGLIERAGSAAGVE